MAKVPTSVIAANKSGLKGWQKVAIVGGLIWIITREK